MTRFFEGLVADVRLLGEDAEAAAGGVHQNSVRHGQVGICLCAVGDPGLHVGKPHPLHGLADQLDAVLADVAAHQPPFVPHLLDEEQALAAGGSAEVEDGIAGLCLHTEGCQLAGLSLHMVVALPEQFVVCRTAGKSCQHAAGHNTLPHLCCALLCEQRTQLCSAGLDGICAQAGQPIISLMGQDAQCFIRVVFVEEFRHIPPGRAKHHQALDLVCKDGSV